MASSLEAFSVTSHKKRVPEAPFEGIERVRGVLKIKVVMSKVILILIRRGKVP